MIKNGGEMTMSITFRNTPRGFGKRLAAAAMVDRYEAAIRLERARQLMREAVRYGFTVTEPMAAEIRNAEAEYDQATQLCGG